MVEKSPLYISKNSLVRRQFVAIIEIFYATGFINHKFLYTFATMLSKEFQTIIVR